jgi:hypothetical protein
VGQHPYFNRKGSRLAEVARWVFVVTAILDSFQTCCLVKIAHYTNQPRQERAPDKSRCGKLEAPLTLAADSGQMTGRVENPAAADAARPGSHAGLT